MGSTSVTLDDATVTRLRAGNGAPVPLRNPAGEVIGYYLSLAQMAKVEEEHAAVVAWLDSLWSPEDIDRVKERLEDTSRPKRTMAEVLRLVEGE